MNPQQGDLFGPPHPTYRPENAITESQGRLNMTQPTQTTEHTPWPWHLNHERIQGPHDECVALVGAIDEDKAIDWPTSEPTDTDLEAEANARLIAAAPELLAALEQVRNAPWAATDAEIVTYIIALCTQSGAVPAAIAKARGQSNA